MTTSSLDKRFVSTLSRRNQEGTLRTLSSSSSSSSSSLALVDFSSNDYLGLARCTEQLAAVSKRWETRIVGKTSTTTTTTNGLLGATGSRLLSGDSVLAHQLEDRIARIHGGLASLIFSSGYTANLSLLSSVPLPHDRLILDELCHNSLFVGTRSGRGAPVDTFRHNDVESLEQRLREAKLNGRKGTVTASTAEPVPLVSGQQQQQQEQQIFVVVESVYSMEGDMAPLREILNLCVRYGAVAIVDEAHGLGVVGDTDGRGLLCDQDLTSHPALMAAVYTYGKAAGCHGAAVVSFGNFPTLIPYLVNYARPFIYSTALSPHSLVTIDCAYDAILSPNVGTIRRRQLHQRIAQFRSGASQNNLPLLPSTTPIQAVLLSSGRRRRHGTGTGADVACTEAAAALESQYGIKVYPIRYPTVPIGKERLRVILHAHNTPSEVNQLVKALTAVLSNLSNSPSSRL